MKINLLIICTLLSFLAISCHKDEPKGTPLPDNHAVIIKHGLDIPIISLAINNPDFITEVENSPYDGVVFAAGDVSSDVFSGNTVSQSDINAAFGSMSSNTFSREMQNFIKMNVFENIGTAPYEGQHLNTLLDNVKRFAKASKNAGFVGIAFDNESYYNNNNWGWSETDSESICPGKTREECGEIVKNAGYKFGNAILEEWNTVKFMPFFGIWLRNQQSYDVIMANSSHNNWYDENMLEAEFLVGVFKAIIERKEWDETSTAEYMNGGEIYSIETRQQFATIANHLKNELPFQAPQFSDDLRQPYADNVKISFGIYDFDSNLFDIPPYSAEKFVTTAINAAQEADYVWLYNEMYDFWTYDGNDWPTEKAPQEWLDELKNGLNQL